MKQVKRNLVSAVKPSTVIYTLTPEKVSKLLTDIILSNTESTSQEIGLIGHMSIFDTKQKKKHILTKFVLSKVGTIDKSYGSVQGHVFPTLEKLKDILYVDELEIYEIDERRDEIIIRWHTNIATAACVNFSLLQLVSTDYIPMEEEEEKSKKDKKKDKKKNKSNLVVDRYVPMMIWLEIVREHNPYNSDEIQEFLESI
jgi:hypothetical protein